MVFCAIDMVQVVSRTRLKAVLASVVYYDKLVTRSTNFITQASPVTEWTSGTSHFLPFQCLGQLICLVKLLSALCLSISRSPNLR